MNTNLTHSHTKERHIIVGVEVVEEKTYSSLEGTLPTLNLSLRVSSWRLKGNLLPPIEGLWRTFCAQAQSLILDSSSKETTGQPVSTLSATPTGRLSMDASPVSGKKCRMHGCKNESTFCEFCSSCCSLCSP